MPLTIEGTLSATGLRFAIVASRFNGLIVEPLISGAIDAIARSGGDADAVTIVRCPGAWELPQVVKRVVARGGIDAVIALGAVIRGATPHFDFVAGEAASGLASAAAGTDVAVSFGVLTTDTIEQALERAGTKAGNKGFDAALAAIELANLFRALTPNDALRVDVRDPLDGRGPIEAAVTGAAPPMAMVHAPGAATIRAAAAAARKRGRRS